MLRLMGVLVAAAGQENLFWPKNELWTWRHGCMIFVSYLCSFARWIQWWRNFESRSNRSRVIEAQSGRFFPSFPMHFAWLHPLGLKSWFKIFLYLFNMENSFVKKYRSYLLSFGGGRGSNLPKIPILSHAFYVATIVECERLN